MKKVFVFLLVAMLCNSFVFAGGNKENAEKTYSIKLVTSNGSSDPTVLKLIEYTDKMREQTNGKLDIQIYPDGQILMAEEGIEAMRTGSAVISLNDPATLEDYVPVYSTICAPFLFRDSIDIENFAKTDMWADIMAKGDEAGFHLITSIFNFGARSVMADGVEIYKAEDSKGLNIRLPKAKLYTGIFENVGGSFSATSWSNGVTGIETGMLNGAEGTAQRMASSEIFNLMKNPVYSDIRYIVAPCALQISNDYWMSLPEEYRTLMTEQFTLCAEECNKIARDNEEGYIQKLIKGGVKVIRQDQIDLSGFYEAANKLAVELKFDDYDSIKTAVQKIQK